MFASVKLLHLEIHGDERGSLVALEQGNGIPFELRRVYYIFDTSPEVIRGRHAHKSLRQLLVATSGCVDIDCEWNGQKQSFHLNNPAQGLLIEGLVWRVMKNFSNGAVLMVLADAPYNDEDYIRDYERFTGECRAFAR